MALGNMVTKKDTEMTTTQKLATDNFPNAFRDD
jgi:hypothetical protein